MKCARFVAVALLLGMAGCSTFERDYQNVVQSKASALSIEAYEGRWQSEAGRGGDKLWALVSRTAADTYHARFRAKYDWLFTVEEEVDLHVTPGSAPPHATGEADLGWLKGGVYKYDATLTPGRLDATYESKYDHGTFTLERAK